MPRWFRITAQVREKEAFLLWLADCKTRGVWELDENTLVAYAPVPFPKPPSHLVETWMQEEEEEEGDWERKWREGLTTVWVSDDVAVRPPWEPEARAQFDLVIYPAFAFGTGHHPTTVLCLRLIRKHLREGMAFLDVGTGSGVLSFLAWKMGARPIFAVDCDPLAIEEFRRNAALNGVPLEEVHLVLGDVAVIREVFDCIVANVSLHFHETRLGDLQRLLRKGGCLILSGFEERDFLPLSQKARALGLYEVEVMEEASWMAVVYTF